MSIVDDMRGGAHWHVLWPVQHCEANQEFPDTFYVHDVVQSAYDHFVPSEVREPRVGNHLSIKPGISAEEARMTGPLLDK